MPFLFMLLTYIKWCRRRTAERHRSEKILWWIVVHSVNIVIVLNWSASTRNGRFWWWCHWRKKKDFDYSSTISNFLNLLPTYTVVADSFGSHFHFHSSSTNHCLCFHSSYCYCCYCHRLRSWPTAAAAPLQTIVDPAIFAVVAAQNRTNHSTAFGHHL